MTPEDLALANGLFAEAVQLARDRQANRTAPRFADALLVKSEQFTAHTDGYRDKIKNWRGYVVEARFTAADGGRYRKVLNIGPENERNQDWMLL